MKILFILDNFSPITYTSASVITYSLAKELLKKGHKIFVLTSIQDKSKQREERYKGLKIFRIYSKYHIRWRAYLSLYNPRVLSRARKIIKEIEPDVVHFHHIHQHISYHCLKIAKKYAKAVFLTAHDTMLFNYEKLMPKNGNCFYRVSIWNQIKTARKRYNPFRNIAIRHYLKYVDKIFAVSNSLKKVLGINGINNVETIYNGIDVDNWKTNSERVKKFKKKYNLQDKKIILFSGRLSEAKGGKVILKAMKKVVKEVNNAILLVVGKKGSYGEEMMNLSKKLGIENKIVFVGFLKEDELKTAYCSINISVSPSLCFETFGMTNLEAMACKKPVISGYFGGPREVVVDKKTGYLIDPNNIKLMAKKIIELLKSPEKANKFRIAGYKRAKKSFSLEKQAKETLMWYKKFIG